MRPHLRIVQDAEHAGAAQLRPTVLALKPRDDLMESIQSPHLMKGNAEVGWFPARHRNDLAAARPIDRGRTPRTRQFLQPLGATGVMLAARAAIHAIGAAYAEVAEIKPKHGVNRSIGT